MRRALFERFEDRIVLNGSPELISILSNSGDAVYARNTGGAPTVLHAAPRELDLFFTQGSVIDPATLGGIQVVGAGADGTLNTADDVPVSPGFVGLGATPNEVILRFSQTLPDGTYAVNLIGNGPNALADTNSPPDLFSSGNPAAPDLQVTFQVSAAPQVVSVVPQPVSYDPASGALKQAQNEIDVYFDKAIQTLPQSVNQLDPALFQLIYTAGTANTNDDYSFRPTSVSFDPSANKATLIFANPLESLVPGASGGSFRLRIGNDQAVSGDLVSTTSHVVAIPEPGSTFGDSQQPNLAPYSAGILDSSPSAEHQLIQTSLGPSSISPGLAYPGGNYGPGVRNVPVQQHVDLSESPLSALPTPGTIPVLTYNFPAIYGSTAGNPQLQNVITTEQETLAREIFQLWSHYLGVQFKEVSDPSLGAADLGIVTGVVQAVDPTAPASLAAIAGPAPTSPLTGLNGKPEYLAVMNANTFATESLYGGPWFSAAMQQIGRLLGLGFDGEGAPGTIMGLLGASDPATGAAPEAVYPGNADILHGQYIYRPQSDNVDMYQFTVNSAGTFDAETIAQRLTDANGSPTPSGLNTVLTLYDQTNVIQTPHNGGLSVIDGSRFTIDDGVHPPVTFEFAANGRTLSDGNVAIDYSTGDSSNAVAKEIADAINNNIKTSGLNASASVQFDRVVLSGPLTVTPGGSQGGVTYTVSRQIVARNDDYFGADSFVKLHLTPGVYYVAVTSTGNTQFNPNVAGSGSGGTTQGPYDLKLDFSPDRVRSLTDTSGTPLQGNSNGTSGGAYDFWFNVGNTIFVDKTPPANVSGSLGSITNPYTNIGQALQVAADRIITPAGSAALAGQTFVVNDGFDPPVTFEFVDAAANPSVTPGSLLADGNSAVPFNVADLASDIATRVYYAISQSTAPLQVAPSHQGNVVDVTGASSVDVKNAPALLSAVKLVRILGNGIADKSIGVPVGATGAQVAAGSTFQISAGTVTSTFAYFNGDAIEVSAATGADIIDGSTFSIAQGLNTVTFEFALNGRAVAAGHLAIAYGTADSKAKLGLEIAQAINAAAAAGRFGANSPVSAVYSGIGSDQNAVVSIGSDSGTTYDVSVSGLVLQTGVKQQLMPNTIPVYFRASDSANQLAQDMAGAINASPLAQQAGGDIAATVGQSAVAYTNGIAWFVNLAGVGTISINTENINGQPLNSQPGLSLVSASNAQPYEIGKSQFGGVALADGATMNVPQGVTVMIDAGAVFKLEGANISVGVNSPSVDRSHAALQVLGTPSSSVYFTSFHNNAVGTLTDTVTAPAPGDWGGIVFGHNADLEQQGIFLDSVNHARLTYGGGGVVVDGIQSTYTPIDLQGSRPAITNNTILSSHDAAISADPNSFAETIFGSPAYNPSTGHGLPASQAFTSDYERAGPDILGNTLAVTQPGAQLLNVVGAGQIVPGQTFTINTPGAATGGNTPNVSVASVFEFVNSLATVGVTPGELLPDGNYAVPFNPGSQTVPVQPADTAQQIATDIVNAILGAKIGVTASVAGSGAQVAISGVSNVTPSSPTSMTAPSGRQLVDGETFVVKNLATGAQTTFEFDNNGQVANGHVAVTFNEANTATTVAAAIAAAINGSNAGVAAVATSAQVILAGSTVARFGSLQGAGVALASSRTLTLSAGNAVTDGTTFVITNARTGAKVTFEYQLNTDTTSVAPGQIAIKYSTFDADTKLASATAAAINQAGLGVVAVASNADVSLLDVASGQFISPLSVQSSVVGNTLNGLFVRTRDQATQAAQTLTVAARWTATDIPYVLSDNLIVSGAPGGQLDNTPRLSGRLEIDAGATVKLANARIETQMGANFIAEGTASAPIVFTSLHDNSYGGGGTFATDGISSSPLGAAPGDWAGLYFAPTSHGSLDHALIAYGGGQSTVQGNSDAFNAIEIHQADVRIANSSLQNNASGLATATRGDLEGNDAATIYVLGAQPVIVNNVFQDNQGSTISINANSLTSSIVPDPGRSTGAIDRFTQFDNNRGPLVRLNKIGNVATNVGAINGMLIRGGTLDTSSVWDDTDIVHVVESQIQVPNVDSRGGLMLESSPTASLVVKFQGANSGLTATGAPLDITNRIGGSVHVLGTPNHPVVLTALGDETVGAGLTPAGRPNLLTDNASLGGAAATPQPGQWKGITLDQYSNDTNVATVNESEPAYTGGVGSNESPSSAQNLGQLAPNSLAGNDTQRLGFTVNGTISPNSPGDVDTYSFQAQPGTQVWISLGRTSPSLDSVVELVSANGTVLARSDNALNEANNPALLKQELPGNLAQPLASGSTLGGNYDPNYPNLSNTIYDPASSAYPSLRNLFSSNPLDAGFRVVLPGVANGSTPSNYYVRVYSKNSAATGLAQYVPGTGDSSGPYQLQIRLQELEQFAGSTVQHADIRYAATGINVQGLPGNSPLVGDAGQNPTPTTTDASSLNQASPLQTAQDLGNLLTTKQGAINVAGNVPGPTQVTWYKFELGYSQLQAIQGLNAGTKTWSTIFDVNYADGLSRPNTTISIFDSAGKLIYVGRGSNVPDDQSSNSPSASSNLSFGSYGQLDPYVGSVQLPAGASVGAAQTYYVAISSDAALPQALDATYSAGSANGLVRLEPVDSVNRIVEDHIGSQGGQTAQAPSSLTPMFNGTVDASAFDPTKPITPTSQQIQQIQQLNTSAVPLSLGNVVLFVDQGQLGATPGHLQTVNPFTGTLVTDIGPTPGTGGGFDGIAMRNDGQLYGLTIGPPGSQTDANSGIYTRIDTGTAAGTQIGSDGIKTYDLTNATPPAVQQQKVGVQIHAVAFVQNGANRQLYAVGSYIGGNGSPGFSNGLYQLDPNTGAVLNPPSNPAAPPTNPQPKLLNPAGVSSFEQITGLASINGVLYAVTNAGGLYVVNNPSGAASVQFVGKITDANGNAVSFTSLTDGPPDVSNGAYANDLFAADAQGNLWAFNTAGVPQTVFSNGQASIPLGTTNVTGLAFSTLDYNLWHVTDARAGDAGHGIASAPDQSRNGLSNAANQAQAGNLSYYFGLENPNAAGVIDTASNMTLQPGAANYATNASVYGTYNLPGGALGSLQTNGFSLSNYNAGDAPTLYFNYFLNSGQNATNTPVFKSSARVLISSDGGKTWDEVATNNPARTAYNPATDPQTGSLGSRQDSQTSELPSFDSASAGAPVTTLNGQPAVDPRQQVQQLFDGSGTWRQARIDLSNYAGKSNLMLRFDFSTAGSMNEGLPGDQFGAFNSPSRGQDNGHEGFYVDDLVVGLAGRGEMVTGSSSNTQFFAPKQSSDPNAPTQVQTGRYQLDVRPGTPYAVTANPNQPDIRLVHSYDVNDRLTDGFTIIAPTGSALQDGQTFQVNDGVHVVTFEFAANGRTVSDGNAAISYSTSDAAATVASKIAAAINANANLKGVRATVSAGDRVDFFGATDVSSTNSVAGSLTVDVSNQTLTESGAASSTQVTINRTNLSPSALATAVSVQLQAIDVAGGGASQDVIMTDPTTNATSQGGLLYVLIPAGATSVTINVQAVKQTAGSGGPELADGPQKVAIVATASQYGSSSNTLDVTDDAGVTPTLSVAISSPTSHTILENAGANAATGVVTRNTPYLNTPLVVNLTSLDPSSATVPATITIPAGQLSATFPINAVDDNVLRQQPVNVVIVASAASFASGNASLAVRDDGDASQVPLNASLWTAQGPAPVTGGLETNITGPGNTPNPISGGVQTVLVDPADPTGNTLFVGAVNGGIWETTNALDPNGPTWRPLTDKMPSLSIGALQFDPTDATYNTMIAGIGRFSSLDAAGSNSPAGGELAGLMQSTDGGQTWSVITPSAASAATPVGQNISGVAERGNIIMAGANADFGSSGGLLRSTDGGNTFVRVSDLANSGLPAGPVTDLVGDPIDPNRFFVAVLGANGGIFMSSDAGATWTDVTPTGLRSLLNANPAGDIIRIADSGKAIDIAYEKFDSANNQTTLAAVYQSPVLNISSGTWVAMELPTTTENGNSIGVRGGYLSIAADPTNPALVYLGGYQQPGPFPNTEGATGPTGRIFRGDSTRPTGSQWTEITDNNANGTAPPADSRALAFDGAQLLETDDGGIYALSNPSTTGVGTPSGSWTSLVGNLAVTEIHSVAYDANTHTVLAGAVADAGTPEQVTAGSTVWTDYSRGSGGDVAVDNSIPGQSIRYTSGAQMANFEATTYDAQGNITNVTSPPLLVGGVRLSTVDPSLPQVTTFALNSQPGTPGWMVIGGENAVYESRDGGQTLVSLGGGGAGAGALFGAAMAYGGVSGGVSNPYVLWVGVGTKVYLRSTQSGALAATNYAGGDVQSLAINPTNWHNAFIVDSSGHVWQTVNGGASFQDVTGNLTGASGLTDELHSVAFVPGNATNNLVYVGARDGVYQMQTSTPGAWSRYGAFMPHAPVYSLKYVPSQQLLVAGTLGRGAFTASAIGAAGDITLALDQNSQPVPDDGGVITGTVTRSGTFGNLTVVLNSSDTGLVPTTSVTIPDGQTSASFTINVNDLLDAGGNEVGFSRETVFLTPQAGGLNPVSAFVNVSDDGAASNDDAPALTVTLATSQMDPNAGVTSIAGTVTRNTPTDQPLTVSLLSSDPRASVPQTVTIPAGQTSAVFTVANVDQFANDGQPHTVTITAAARTYQGLQIVSANGDGSDDEASELVPDGDESFTLDVLPTQHILAFNRQGDANIVPPQGQIVIQDNRISHSLGFGIAAQAAPRTAGGSAAYPGVPINLTTINTDRVAPGVTITNNLLVDNTQGGISISGDANSGNVPAAVVPIARVLNNTIYGGASPSGAGVQVTQNASPTILNNIFANLATGVSVDGTSSSTVLEGSVYQNNGTNLSGNVFNNSDLLSYSLAPTDPLFANAANNDFYLAAGSKAIDSGINQLPERSDLTAAKSLTGIAPSPTNAPTLDLYGQRRTADPESNPNGTGSSVYIDRGAIERVDFTGPTSALAEPIDNSSADQDPTLNEVHQVGGPLPYFAVQLTDSSGSGIDDTTVDSSKFALYRNGVQLKAGADYYFQYDTNTKTVYFMPSAGSWATGNQYTIAINNGVKFDPFNGTTPASASTGIKDLAGNLLQANSATGFTRYDILLQSSLGDAPTIGVPGPQTVLEHGLHDVDAQGNPTTHALTFGSSTGNAITVFNIDAPADPASVTLSTQQGTLTLGPTISQNLSIGGNGSGSITLSGSLADINTALDGLTFTPTLYLYGAASIDISATDPLTQLTGTNTVSVSITQVNQPPSLTLGGQQAVQQQLPARSVLENSQFVFSGASNQLVMSDPDAKATDVESVSIAVTHGTVTLGQTAGIQLLSGTGVNDSAVSFTGTLAELNAALAGMAFNPEVNFGGAAAIQFTLNDQGHNGAGPQGQQGIFPQSATYALNFNVTPVNQPPFVKQNNPLSNLTVNENAPPTVIDLTQVIGDADLNDVPPEAFPSIAVTGNSNPTLVSVAIDPVTHLMTLTYQRNQFGSASITLTATDAGGNHPALSFTFQLTVNKVELAPVAGNDSYVYTENTPLVVTTPGVLQNDVELNGEPLKAVLYNVPAHGKLVLNPDGSFTYTPDAGFNGRDQFVYKADNGTFRTTATVTLDSPTSRWVARMYTEVLGRSTQPADSEINYWVNQLDHGESRKQVANFFVTSPERRGHIIDQLYQTYLGRAVDPAGLNYWLSVWAANQGPEQVQAGIIGSLEYFNTAGGTPQAWVVKLYQNLLDRNPGPSEVAYWASWIQTHSRASVVLGFVTSDEYRLGLLQGLPGDPNQVGWYEQFLHRPIDASGAQYWLQQMKNGYPQEAILEGILASGEYFNRS